MMFSKNKDATIAQLGEIQLIEQIKDWLGPVSPPSPSGIGDDCAILPKSDLGPTLISTDSLCYKRHFDERVTAEKAGAKLVKRNLSDIAAMGGIPSSAVVALISGPDLCTDWLKAFFEGIKSACLTYNLKIIGGDIAETDNGQFASTMTIIGQASQPIQRKTGSAGDALFVTGRLGGSLLAKHLDFIPRLKEGQWLSHQKDCCCLIDLTDGLAKDLQSIRPHHCSVAIDPDQIPIAEDAEQLALSSGKTPLIHALSDGEDYELLFAVDKETPIEGFTERWQAVFPELPLRCIGQFVPEGQNSPLINLNTGESLSGLGGYEHFKIH